MNRILRVSAFFAVTLALAVGLLFAQGGQRGMLERKAWFVDGNNKISEMLYWRIYLGEYDVKLKRNVDGEGQINVSATMNFDFFSSGYIEGNGFGSKGKVNSLPGMRIRLGGGESVEIKINDIDYIYDYGTKVVTKDGRRGDFMIGAEGGSLLEIKRFQLSEYRMVKGSFGEMELKEASDRMPIVALAFSKEAAAKAAKEPVSNY